MFEKVVVDEMCDENESRWITGNSFIYSLKDFPPSKIVIERVRGIVPQQFSDLAFCIYPETLTITMKIITEVNNNINDNNSYLLFSHFFPRLQDFHQTLIELFIKKRENSLSYFIVSTRPTNRKERIIFCI